MSHTSNETLLEQARHWAEECAGTSLGDQIQALKDAGDMEELAVKVKEAEDHHHYLEIINDQIRETSSEVRESILDEAGDIF